MHELRARVWFYDGEDDSTGEYYTLAEAFGEGVIELDGNGFDNDECIIIEPSLGHPDRKGSELYHGDILKNVMGYPASYKGCEKNLVGVLYYDTRLCAWYVTTQPEDGGNHEVVLIASRLKEYERVGNIHETPELLEAANG